MTIWKFELKITDYQTVMIPFGASALSVQAQNDKICLWAIVDPKAKLSPYRFRIVGTGNNADDLGVDKTSFLGTVQTHNGALVWHVFSVMP